jgi:hypothetical protein
MSRPALGFSNSLFCVLCVLLRLLRFSTNHFSPLTFQPRARGLTLEAKLFPVLCTSTRLRIFMFEPLRLCVRFCSAQPLLNFRTPATPELLFIFRVLSCPFAVAIQEIPAGEPSSKRPCRHFGHSVPASPLTSLNKLAPHFLHFIGSRFGSIRLTSAQLKQRNADSFPPYN